MRQVPFADNARGHVILRPGSAGEAWDEVCRGLGIEVLPPVDAASLLPWTKEQEQAFTRAIEETGERIEVGRSTRTEAAAEE